MLERRNIVDVIDACCELAPELKPLLAEIRDRAWYIAPEIQSPGLWRAAHNILADWSKSGVPLETIDRVGRLWAAIDPLPSRGADA